jgi:GNAT superfamily N-acetyltransferase
MMLAYRPNPVATVRPATLADVPRLVEMNRAAYPELVADDVVWNAAQLREHLARFPAGQRLALLDGAVAGAISTFVVRRGRDPLAQHTWLDITDHGTFASHDSGGDTLYLADVYVDPAAWGKRVGTTLYGALFSLCGELGLKRVVAGGRLWGYHEHAGRMTPDQYVERVLRGELRDRVLDSQVRAGFEVKGILVGYLADPRSRDYATLLEWVRPAGEAAKPVTS